MRTDSDRAAVTHKSKQLNLNTRGRDISRRVSNTKLTGMISYNAAIRGVRRLLDNAGGGTIVERTPENGGNSMPSMSRTFEPPTDDNGYFSVTEKYDPKGWSPSFKIKIWVKLIEPNGTTIHGTLDIDADDGSPSNLARSFEVASGQEEYLGRWTVDLNSPWKKSRKAELI